MGELQRGFEQDFFSSMWTLSNPTLGVIAVLVLILLAIHITYLLYLYRESLKKRFKKAAFNTVYPYLKKVLLVDDDDDELNLMLLILTKEGIEADVAKDGIEALNKLEEHADYDAVIVDVMMPRMNGIELGRKIHRKLPILMVSGKNIGEEKDSIGNVCDNFMTKEKTKKNLLHAAQEAVLQWQEFKNAGRFTSFWYGL